MENHTADAALDPSAAPFTSDLARLCASTTTYSAVGRPSLPNYLAATSGSTQGIHDDAGPATHALDTDNLFRQVRASGGSVRSYEEEMTENCQLHSSGTYAVKHNPEAYYVGGSDRAECARDNVALGSLTAGALTTDLATDHLPTFSFITPDLCHDTHDCPVGTGDAWLRDWLGLLLDSTPYRAGSTAIFVVWDEPTPMAMLAASPSIPIGTRLDTAVDHFSLLRTTEDLLALPPLGQATDAISMRDALGL